MKTFRDENEIRSTLENDFPVPESLSPESIEKKLSESKKASEKRSNIKLIKRSTAVAAAIALLATGTLAVLHFSGIDIPEISTGDGKQNVSSDVTENEPQTVLNVYSKNSYKDIYHSLMELKPQSNGFFFLGKDIVDNTVITGELETNGDLDYAAGAAPGDLGEEPDGSDDYYKTYLQTEGVDEADQIKTDGRFIYYTTQDFIYVVDPNGGDPEVSDKKEIDGNYKYYYYNAPELYLSDGKLITVYSDYEDLTHADVYEVTDEGTLKSLTSYAQQGYYSDSRMIDGRLYLMTTSYVDLGSIKRRDYDTYIPTFEVNGRTELVAADDIYISQYCRGYCYTTVGSFDTTSSTPHISVKSTLGSEAELYCSLDNLYLMRTIYEENKTLTEISKISLSNGELKMSSAAKVEGYINDQFSADEYNGYFRIATTRSEDNAVYILDSELNIVSCVDGLGINEIIRSVSFSGDTAYVVTFRQTDPLYTIDLSDPKKPIVTDALKVSGFSTHLRSFGDGLLLGFGQEADEETGIVTGIKLSMFKQSESGTNEEIAKTVIGDNFSYTYSASVWDHKYLMILPDKALIGFPLYEDTWIYYNEYDSEYTYGYYYMLYSYTENGFEELARIDLDECIDFFGNAPRAIYIDDVIYIFADYQLICADINSGDVIATITIE